jgi:hypothetical protein
MLRNSIIALSAATVLGATALAPAEALAHGGGGGGSHNATDYRPTVNSAVSAQLGLGGGLRFVPRPHPPCPFCFPPPQLPNGAGTGPPPGRWPPTFDKKRVR